MQVEILEKNKKCSACFTNVRIEYEDGGPGSMYHTGQEGGYVRPEKIILGAGSVYPTSAILFNKEKLFSSRIYQHISEFSSWMAGDTILIYALLSAGSIYFISKPTAVYRRRKQGIFSSIKDNKGKMADRKLRQIVGYKYLFPYMNREYQMLLNRKISVESLFVDRHGSGYRRFTGLKDMTVKE